MEKSVSNDPCLAGLSFYLFLVQFSLAPRPFLSPKLFADLNFIVGIILYAVNGLIMYATLALLAPYLQTLMNYPVVTAGIVLAPRGVGILLAAMICGRLLRVVGARVLLSLGLVIGIYALYQMTSWTPDIGARTIVGVGVNQGLSIGLVAIPLNITAFATLPSERRTEATSVYSLMRNLGSSIGISMTGSLLQSNTQVNRAMLAEGVGPFNHLLQSRHVLQFWDPSSLHGAAMLNGEITRQARIIAYIDDFKLMLVLAIVTAPLVLLTRPSQRR